MGREQEEEGYKSREGVLMEVGIQVTSETGWARQDPGKLRCGVISQPRGAEVAASYSLLKKAGVFGNSLSVKHPINIQYPQHNGRLLTLPIHPSILMTPLALCSLLCFETIPSMLKKRYFLPDSG